MRDPYSILGVPKTALVADIKKAYRRLAKANHPDQTKDPKAKERFNEATQAYDLLSDEKKRAAFDRGEIDGEGKPRFAGFPGGGQQPGRGGPGFEHFEFNMGGRPGGGGADPGDIFADLFSGGGRRRPGASPRAMRGEDAEVEVSIGLREAANGGSVRVTMPNGRTLDINIPAASEDGRQIRLKGQGQPGPAGPEASGDAIVTLRIARHPLFRVEGRDLYLDLPVTLYEAALGGAVQVPTLTGTVEMNAPPGAAGGKAMRLRGKGLPAAGANAAGDLYVTLKILLPEQADAELTKLMQRWREEAPYFPRKEIISQGQ